MARVLRPGRRFSFVVFELDAERVAGLPIWDHPVGDCRPLLDVAGFEVLSYEQMPHWRAQVADGFGALLAERAALESELGHAAAAVVLEASITLEVKPYSGHVHVIAELR